MKILSFFDELLHGLDGLDVLRGHGILCLDGVIADAALGLIPGIVGIEPGVGAGVGELVPAAGEDLVAAVAQELQQRLVRRDGQGPHVRLGDPLRQAVREQERNKKQIGVQWHFTAEDARTKLKRLYPKPLFSE